MKRFIVLIIGAAILGKIFAAELVRLAENSSKPTKNLGQSLFEKESAEQLNMDRIRSNLDMVRKMPPRVFNANKFKAPVAPKALAPLLPVTKVAKAEDKPKTEEESKADADRRKKRQKNLEEKAAETAQAKPQAAPPAPLIAPPPPPDYNTSFAGAPISAGVSTNPPTTTTTTSAPVAAPVSYAPTRVSTQSNGNAATAGWIKLLTTDPTAAAMTSFEGQLTSNAITQTEYYQVLSAMQSSSNVQSRNYAVQGAAIYQNIYSFKVLADEAQNETNATIRQNATSAISAYAATADHSILVAAQASGDAAEKTEATLLLGGGTQTVTGSTNNSTNSFHL